MFIQTPTVEGGSRPRPMADALGFCHDETDSGVGDPVRIEAVIGYWIAREREARDMTQAGLGDALGRYLDKAWPRQAVSAAEKGRRAFTAAELVAFALVLNRPVETLLTPPEGVTTVELGELGSVSADVLRFFTPTARRDDLAELLDMLQQLRLEVPLIAKSAKLSEALLDSAATSLWRVARGLGLDENGSLISDETGDKQ